MKPMTEKETVRWEKKRQQGKGRFLIVCGVLLWGVPMGLIWPVAMSAILGWKLSPAIFVLSITVFMFGGIIFGWKLWQAMERRYAARVDMGSAHRGE